MTDEQRTMLADLRPCTFFPGSFDKRFVANLSGYPDDKELTEKQAETLTRLHHRYREQIAKQRAKS